MNPDANLTAPTLIMLTTVAGAGVLTAVLTEIIKRAWNPPSDIQDRFMPLIAMVVGIGVVLFADFGLGLLSRTDLAQGVVNGIFAGLSACGMYDTFRGLTKK